MNQNILIKQRTTEIQAQLDSEKAWWEKKRTGIQSDFMKEIEGSDGKPTASAQQKKTGSSDDDAVLVDAGGPDEAQGGGGAAKKKGKK